MLVLRRRHTFQYCGVEVYLFSVSCVAIFLKTTLAFLTSTYTAQRTKDESRADCKVIWHLAAELLYLVACSENKPIWELVRPISLYRHSQNHTISVTIVKLFLTRCTKQRLKPVCCRKHCYPFTETTVRVIVTALKRFTAAWIRGLSTDRNTWRLVDGPSFRFAAESSPRRHRLDCSAPIYELDLAAPTNWMSIAFGRQFVSARRRGRPARSRLPHFLLVCAAIINDFRCRSSVPRSSSLATSVNISNQTAVIMRLAAFCRCADRNAFNQSINQVYCKQHGPGKLGRKKETQLNKDTEMNSATIFTVRLRVMQRTVLPRSFCLSVCLSVCPSVKRVLCNKPNETCAHILTPHHLSFLSRRTVGRRRLLVPAIVGQTDPVGEKTPIFNRYSLAEPQTVTPSKTSSIYNNRKFTTRFPVSLTWTSYVVPKLPIGGGRSKCKTAVFRENFTLLKESLLQSFFVWILSATEL